MNYSYFKPFTPSSAGGTSRPVTRAVAKRLISSSKTVQFEHQHRRTIGERLIKLSNNRTIFIY